MEMKKETVIKQNAGIDVSKDGFRAAFTVSPENQRIAVRGTHTSVSTRDGFEAFRSRIASKRAEGLEIHLTVEAAGV
jgi:hypothetical protein